MGSQEGQPQKMDYQKDRLVGEGKGPLLPRPGEEKKP